MLFRKQSLAKKSFAKINLSLKIVGNREDGYHLLEMVNLPLTLHDVIEINILEGATDTYVTADDPTLNGMKSNLCHQAIEEMRNVFHFKENFLVQIHKEIPFAAGLGGGSSNAAVVIESVNELLNLKASHEQLMEIALKIGADVPFFFLNKPALLTGIGEKMKEIRVQEKYHCLLVKPTQGVSTAACYEVCDRFERLPINTSEILKGLEEGDDSLIQKNMGNDLQAPAISFVPEIAIVLKRLTDLGFTLVGMSGSGSCCFGLTKDLKKAKEAYKRLENSGYTIHLCDVIR
ncbi:MAG TPA: 4-(cytidine 5'-diphospho)-2-C-methyl-D-erythritol kinase [Firmicutes bacterium]|nr:4-(cytidine 5'-diphospho)-2-C-methyl-D-erythritol kinase [Bacillota bacterium]